MKSRLWTWVFVLIIPVLAVVGVFPFYNRAEPFILGFPFIYFWIFSWVLLTPLCMFIGFKLDPENKEDSHDKSSEKVRGV